MRMKRAVRRMPLLHDISFFYFEITQSNRKISATVCVPENEIVGGLKQMN